jgi:hypothetical protein
VFYSCFDSRKKQPKLKAKIDARGAIATMPDPYTSRPHPERIIYPYLRQGSTISHADFVWASDISVIPMRAGFAYLAEENELDLGNRMKTLAVTNHGERLIWFFGSLGRSYMKRKTT